jgi:hypothetical protein
MHAPPRLLVMDNVGPAIATVIFLLVTSLESVVMFDLKTFKRPPSHSALTRSEPRIVTEKAAARMMVTASSHAWLVLTTLLPGSGGFP